MISPNILFLYGILFGKICFLKNTIKNYLKKLFHMPVLVTKSKTYLKCIICIFQE